MAYSFQTFTVGQVLPAAQTNQIEVNIRDHVHGVDGVSMATRIAKVTRQSSTSFGADPAGWRAMLFDTEVTDNGSFFNPASPGMLIIPANGIYTALYVSDQAGGGDLDMVSMVQINSNRNLIMANPTSLRASGVGGTDVGSHYPTDIHITFIASTNDIVRLLFAAGGAQTITGPLGGTVNSGGRYTSLTINQIG